LDRFRRLSFLAWFALFPLLFIGYGGAEAGVLCIETHHVSFEFANHGRGEIAFPAGYNGPLDKHHGDHCLDIPLSIGDIQPAAYKFQQTDLPSSAPDIIGALSPGQDLKIIPAKSLFIPNTASDSSSRALLSFVILLI